MDATVRRTRTRPMKTKSRTKDTFIEKTVIQLVVSIMVLCVCIAARYGGVLAAEREQLSLLLRQEDSELTRELASELFKTEQYVEMALSYQRVNSVSSDFVLGRRPLEPLVRQAVKKYAPLFNRRRIALDLQPLSVQVLTDEKWLCFVVEQLLSNALKYTPTGGRITIRLEPPATLVIQDTGIGIAPEDLPRVCEKGYTGRNGRQDMRATGIGLYLCKQVLTRLGHGLELRSVPGEGTTVLVDLASADFHDND